MDETRAAPAPQSSPYSALFVQTTKKNTADAACHHQRRGANHIPQTHLPAQNPAISGRYLRLPLRGASPLDNRQERQRHMQLPPGLLHCSDDDGAEERRCECGYHKDVVRYRADIRGSAPSCGHGKRPRGAGIYTPAGGASHPTTHVSTHCYFFDFLPSCPTLNHLAAVLPLQQESVDQLCTHGVRLGAPRLLRLSSKEVVGGTGLHGILISSDSPLYIQAAHPPTPQDYKLQCMHGCGVILRAGPLAA